jgi:fused signal recognition particle receptor
VIEPVGRFGRLFAGLSRARENLRERLGAALRPGRPLDESVFTELEEALISADLGLDLSLEVVERVRRQADGRAAVETASLRAFVRDELLRIIPTTPAATPPAAPPRVTLLVGVNGGGKTTTAGKLAALHAATGRSVVVAAADTFRAAAVEQLARWTERAGARLVRGAAGADPSSVLFDALRAARADRADEVVADTAGRLHTHGNLMAELAKMVRVCGREVPGAPHETYLVMDATTGQNGLSQAKEFSRATPLTGVILTKLDGTARGGIAVGIGRELGVALRYVGVGEGSDDLMPFQPEEFVDGLLATDAEAARHLDS